MNNETLTSLTASIIAVLIVAAGIVLTALQIPVPDALWQGFALVLGFFFGLPAGRAQARAR